MKLIVFLALAAVPILEIVLLVKLGQWVGVFPTILLVLGTAMLGTYVLHRQGFKVLNRVMESINAGKTPVGPAVDGAFLMTAGGLLIAPGIITDCIGALLLIPQLRHRIAAWSVKRFLRSAVVRSETFTRATYKAREEHDRHRKSGPDEGPVIDGEFERIDERNIEPRKAGQRSHANGAKHPNDWSPDDRPSGRL